MTANQSAPRYNLPNSNNNYPQGNSVNSNSRPNILSNSYSNPVHPIQRQLNSSLQRSGMDIAENFENYAKKLNNYGQPYYNDNTKRNAVPEDLSQPSFDPSEFNRVKNPIYVVSRFNNS